MGVEQYSLVANDWLNLEAIINDLTQRVVGQELHPTSDPTFADLTLSGSLNLTGDLDIGGTLTLDGLTASRIVATDASKGLESVDLASWVAATANETTVADDGDGTITVGLVAVPTLDGLILNGTTAIGLDMSGGTFATAIQKWPAGTIQSTGDLVFQPTSDGTTRYQWLNAAGDAIVLSIDTDRKQVGIGTNAPESHLHLKGGLSGENLEFIIESDTGANVFITLKADTFVKLPLIQFYDGNVPKAFIGLDRTANIIVGSTRNDFFINVVGSKLHLSTDNVTRLTIDSGKVGFSEPDPETLLELTHAQPDITLHCDTHSDGSRKSNIFFKGEKANTTEHFLAAISVDHDGTGNNVFGKMVLGVNTGSGVVERLRLDTSGVKIADMTQGSVLFVGASGLVSQDNAGLFWDNTTNNLNIRLDQDGLTQGTTRNDSASSSAMARWVCLNGNSGTSFEKLGTNYTTTGRSGRRANAGVIIDSGATGLNFIADGAQGELSFYTGGQTAANERVTILSGGNVGINTSSPDTKLQVVGDCKFGEDTTNYSKFETDGTYVMNGTATVWNDLVLPLSSARVPAANAPAWTSFIGNLNNYTYGLNDFQEFSTELEHGYKGGSTFEFHIHGAVNGSNVDDRTIKFEIEYTVADTPAETGFGDVYPATTTINGEITIPADTTDLTAFSIGIGTNATGSFIQGAIINGRVRRIASTGTEPTGDPFLTEVGIHAEDDTIGTRTVTTK